MTARDTTVHDANDFSAADSVTQRGCTQKCPDLLWESISESSRRAAWADGESPAICGARIAAMTQAKDLDPIASSGTGPEDPGAPSSSFSFSPILAVALSVVWLFTCYLIFEKDLGRIDDEWEATRTPATGNPYSVKSWPTIEEMERVEFEAGQQARWMAAGGILFIWVVALNSSRRR